MSNISLQDLAPRRQQFLDDVIEGLEHSPKTLPCKYLYDRRGSVLFDQICELDEYYLTRTELAIMEDHVAEMASAIGPECALIEFGSGSSLKTRLLLDALDSLAVYVPIDISRQHLRETAEQMQQRRPELNIQPVCADFTEDFELPEPPAPVRRRVVYFPGSTIGNFGPYDASVLLERFAKLAGPGGALLIGVDLAKSPDVLVPAYDDAAGVTASFNRNLLVRINRELGADFDLDRFEHRAIFNAEESRMEMHLLSLSDQSVQIGDATFEFTAGETIHTESSHKYSLERFQELASGAGFTLEKVWLDDQKLFSVQLFGVA